MYVRMCKCNTIYARIYISCCMLWKARPRASVHSCQVLHWWINIHGALGISNLHSGAMQICLQYYLVILEWLTTVDYLNNTFMPFADRPSPCMLYAREWTGRITVEWDKAFTLRCMLPFCHNIETYTQCLSDLSQLLCTYVRTYLRESVVPRTCILGGTHACRLTTSLCLHWSFCRRSWDCRTTSVGLPSSLLGTVSHKLVQGTYNRLSLAMH